MKNNTDIGLYFHIPFCDSKCPYCDFYSMSATDEIKTKYANNPQFCIKNSFLIKDQFIFVSSSSPVIGNKTIAFNQARLKAQKKIVFLRINNINSPTSDICKTIENKTKNLWVITFGGTYKLNNEIPIAKFLKNKRAFYVSAYNLEDIEFEDKSPVTWERIYNDFKNNPTQRNELLFFEIVPKDELSSLKNSIENNLNKQYGKNFALMFFGKDVPAIKQETYDNLKNKYKTLDANTSFTDLIKAVNEIPYDTEICNLLADKFEQMDMFNCRDIMLQCGKQNNKLTILKPVEEIKKEEKSSKELELPQKQSVSKSEETYTKVMIPKEFAKFQTSSNDKNKTASSEKSSNNNK